MKNAQPDKGASGRTIKAVRVKSREKVAKGQLLMEIG